MSVNNSINSGSAPSLTLDTADLIVISDTSNSGALSTCEAQDIADLGGGGAVAGVYPIAAVTFSSVPNILYQYNVSSVSDYGGSFLINYTIPISPNQIILPYSDGGGYGWPGTSSWGSYLTFGTSSTEIYYDYPDTYQYFVVYGES